VTYDFLGGSNGDFTMGVTLSRVLAIRDVYRRLLKNILGNVHSSPRISWDYKS